MRIEDLKQMKVKLLGHFKDSYIIHIGKTNIPLFLTKCNYCGYRNLLWTLFICVTGLLEAFKETTEGAEFFKEEACKGTVCVYIRILGYFVCLFGFFLFAL